MWRRAQYYAGFATFFFVIATWIYFANFHQAPTCFDGKQNAGELGVDCGGGCVRICAFSVEQPVVKWSRSFRVTPGLYNAVAYVENLNREAASREVRYTFSLFDEAGLIISRQGMTILPPDGLYPIFEGQLETGRRVPTRTFIELEPVELWQPSTVGRELFTVVDRSLSDADTRPSLRSLFRNNGLEEVKEVEVVATIFDSGGTALAASRTFVDNFAPRTDTEIFFTWPEPIATTVRSCEVPTDVALVIDLSGSMSSDQEIPAEPLTSVKTAAASFVSRLGNQDQAAVVSFATDGKLETPLGNGLTAATTISRLAIGSREERAYTNTGRGIEVATEELLSLRHNNNARKVMVLLTDGLATAPGTNEEAEAFALEKVALAKSTDIDIYTIGLGMQVKMEFVQAVATAPEYAYQALTSSDVDRIYSEITSSLCEEGVAVIDIVPKSATGFVPLR